MGARDVLAAYSLVGVFSVTLYMTVSSIRWWNSSERTGPRYRLKDGLSPESIAEPGTMPVGALETFYREGGPEIQASAIRLLKKLYLSHPEAIGLVRENLGSSDPTVRRQAITVLYGLILDESFEYREKVCDNRTIEHLIYGLFESIESPECASSQEMVYRKVALKFINQLNSPLNFSDSQTQTSDSKFMYACIQHGIIDFFIEYDRVAQSHPVLPTLDDLTNQMSPYFLSCYSKVLVAALVDNEKCKLNLVPWHELPGEAWRRARLLALGSCNLGYLTCTHK